MARSKSYRGPYEDFGGNPLLAENEFWRCMGHGTFAESINSKFIYLYHAYNKKENIFGGRQGMIAELIWPGKNSWPVLNAQSGSAENPNINLTFNRPLTEKFWQWDFRNSSPTISQLDGNIHLSGRISAGNLSGIALTVRPVSAHFEVSTEVVNINTALKGLVYYGDAGAAVGLGVADNKVVFWKVKDKKLNIARSTNLREKGPVRLKMKTSADLSIQAYYKIGAQNWKKLEAYNPIDVSFLPQWDRSPRVGLNFNGTQKQKASFSFFKLDYIP
ncbi:hypothetical protein EA772_13705 [Pedobacter sp. G11]|uniref:hypothetical protein n=1 Tax=Pedobacter sp. G11 TaxID=2482728 RepID=UPI000F5FA707|nr:hypothetical protein [Pedobacter sp. G11]AZI26346.1 hypothetical protein EA772_13705 [Pedobacter sp. G11]